MKSLCFPVIIFSRTVTKSVTSYDHIPLSVANCLSFSYNLSFSITLIILLMVFVGIIVDDPRMLISYYMVFMLSGLKRRADYMSNPSGMHTYWQVIMQSRMAAAFSDLSFETKSMWTFLDYLRLYGYCHLLDLVLALILITGTLEYDILHLGYLGFALAFFRLRLKILKERNKIFKFLRIYNFSLIILSLAYQSPFVGDSNEGKCKTTDYIHEVIGFYKYDYGFRITSRSAVVEIIIFMLVSLQSHIFSFHILHAPDLELICQTFIFL